MESQRSFQWVHHRLFFLGGDRSFTITFLFISFPPLFVFTVSPRPVFPLLYSVLVYIGILIFVPHRLSLLFHLCPLTPSSCFPPAYPICLYMRLCNLGRAADPYFRILCM